MNRKNNKILSITFTGAKDSPERRIPMKRTIFKKYGNTPITIALVDIEPEKDTFEIYLFNGMKITYNSTGLYVNTHIGTNKIEESYLAEFLADTGMSIELNKIITQELSLCLRQVRNHTTSMFDFGL